MNAALVPETLTGAPKGASYAAYRAERQPSDPKHSLRDVFGSITTDLDRLGDLYKQLVKSEMKEHAAPLMRTMILGATGFLLAIFGIATFCYALAAGIVAGSFEASATPALAGVFCSFLAACAVAGAYFSNKAKAKTEVARPSLSTP